MNDAGRKRVEEFKERLADLKTAAESLSQDVSIMAEEELQKFDSTPESLQQTENAQKIEAASTSLSEASDALAEGNLAEALEKLEEIE